MAQSRYIFTYQTLCSVTGRTYIGYHSTHNLDDGYIGCGIKSQPHADASESGSHFIRAVKKYGYDNFKVQILSFFDTIKEALEEEIFLVNRKWVDSKSNYNVIEGGKGGGLKSTTEEQDESIFSDFMLGMTKKDIFKKHNISHNILWRITKHRDVSGRINPADRYVKQRTDARNEWISKNKDYYIEEYRSGRLSKTDINKVTPFWIFQFDFLKDVIQDKKEHFIYHENEIKVFYSVNDFKSITGKNIFKQEFSRCDKDLTATAKGFIIAGSEKRLAEKITAISVKVRTSKYTGRVIFLYDQPYTIGNSVDDFCIENGVKRNNFRMMLSGFARSAKGFSLTRREPKKLMKNGEVVCIRERVSDFCKKKDIPLSSYYALMKGTIDNTNGYSRY